MKKIPYFLYIIMLSALLFAGCSKDFLDEAPTRFISPQQLDAATKQDSSLLDYNIAGVYATMYQDGSGGSEDNGADLDHDDFGQKGYDIFSDMLCSDMVLAGLNYGWYGPIVRYQATVDYTRDEDELVWRYYYRIILGANTIIDALGGDDAEQTSDRTRHIMGQAKAMRAYGYFYLTQFYSKEYGDGSQKILPIYTNTEVPNQPKSSAKDVFDLIVKDLTDAIDLLGDFQRDTKDHIDKTVAEGLLSYALAYRGSTEDLRQVVSLTEDIMSQYPVTDSTYAVAEFDANGKLINSQQAGFNNIATPTWMWGADLTLASGLDLVSWWGQVDMFTYSYAWAGDPKVIDDGLYAKIRSDDIRKRQFVFNDDFEGQPINKFFAPDRIIGGQRSVTTDYVYMRSDEFYLLNAEAHARLGEDALAIQSLKKLLDERIKDDSYINSLSGQALLNEIYLQTRIELWGEGKSYLAMKRLKETITRGSNHLYFAGQSFKYDDPKLTFLIPQQEELNNPVLNN
jgi:hypothetical protein